MVKNLIQNLKNGLSGEIVIPPDKSISHRAIIFASLMKNKVEIKNISLGEDCLNTLKIFEKLGVKYEFKSKRDLIIDSSNGLKIDGEIELYCGNSGTTTRLLAGLFSGLDLNVVMLGDASLSKRPMKRVIEPLNQMGAQIESNENKLPLKIKGGALQGITYHSPIASAQVKSCLLLAGLNATGKTRVYEPALSRNHSEIMLEYLGAKIATGKDSEGFWVEIEKSALQAKNLEVVGDISSAAFFMVAAAITPNSSVTIKNVGLNPTRSGIIDVFQEAKIDFELLNERTICNELVADIKVNYTENIAPFTISGDLIPRLIDEIPVLAVLASQAQGKSIVKDAADLRNKESDRIKTIVETFQALGIKITEFEDGFEVVGKAQIDANTTLETYLDHRLAMSYFVLGLINSQTLEIKGFDCTNTSFPEFLELMESLKAQ